MLNTSALKIQVAELVSDGIVVGFSDGTSALYSSQLLNDVRARAEELIAETEVIYPLESVQ